jgi:hypothetical protein
MKLAIKMKIYWFKRAKKDWAKKLKKFSKGLAKKLAKFMQINYLIFFF